MRMIDEDALVDALMTYTWRDEDERTIDDADEKREYIKGWLPNVPTVGGWTSVKDRLPEKQIPVLVYVPPYSNESEKYAEYVGVAYYTYSALGGYWAGTDGNVYGAIGIIRDPIYWMPLPGPPKEENSGNEQHMP